jgi:hypothetical protein
MTLHKPQYPVLHYRTVAHMWNWQTRCFEVAVPQGVQVLGLTIFTLSDIFGSYFPH